jgi:CorA-like Mg2+ transporter protein
MIIDCAHYKDGHRTAEGKVPLEETAARRAAGGFVWLGLFEPGEGTASKKLRPYLRDVHDHLIRVDEGIADQRELLRQVLEANMAVISVEQTRIGVQQNRTIQQLTILATIFLPLTFITGFFGQNFGWLVDQIESLPAFVIYGVDGLAVPIALLITWMKVRMPRADTRAALANATGPAPPARPARCPRPCRQRPAVASASIPARARSPYDGRGCRPAAPGG